METQHNVPIESGALLQKAAELLTKGLSNIFRESASDSRAIEKEGKVGTKYKFWLEDHPNGALIVDIFPVAEKKDTWYIENVEFTGTSKSGKKINSAGKWTGKTVNGEDIMPILQEFLNKKLRLSGKIGRPDTSPDDNTEKFNQSEESQPDSDITEEDTDNTDILEEATKIRATLVKVSASHNIELVAINASTASPKQVTDALAAVAADDEFINQLTDDTPLSIEIVDDTDDYDVNIIEDVDTLGTYSKVFDGAVNFLSNLYAIRWACADTEVTSSVDSLLYTAQEIVDRTARLCIREEHTYPNPGKCEFSPVETESGLSKQAALSLLLNITSTFVDVLDLYYVNVEHDTQDMFDQWMRLLKDESEVTITTKMIQ